MKPEATKLLDAVTVTGAGDAFPMTSSPVNPAPSKATFHGRVAGTGAVSASVDIEVSNDGSHWLVAGTITLSGTTSDQAGLTLDAPWVNVRAKCTAIAGTGAALTVTKGSL